MVMLRNLYVRQGDGNPQGDYPTSVVFLVTLFEDAINVHA
ncbi:hypothetical protein KDA_65230 [Dictyobacter alpinus]|uniref:Uncharacterized protein n=1 Tax=Dictyobacter alpinus TaxID=2014873 RepID=A0A402BI63_9CHLR|nr:hypothetical protein KDA_65230 [Dictyobacter alpinus]